MAKTIGTNDLIEVWASSGTATEPSVAKITGGWQFEEQPPFETMNWVHNHIGAQINYLMRAGVPSWNLATTYITGDAVSHNGALWFSLTSSTNSEPADANSDWGKVPSASDLATIATTGDPADLVGVTASAAELNILDGATLTTAELNFVDGVTSAIQPQIDAKLAISSKATQAEAQTGTNDTKYMTPLKTKQAIDTQTGAILGNAVDLGGLSLGNNTAAHGLGAAPREVSWYLECTTIDGAYAVGDRIYHVSWQTDADANEAFSIWADDTNVGFTLSGGIEVANKASGVLTLNPARWNVYAIPRL